MPEVLDWQRDNPRAVLQQSVRVLGEGGLVAFPTETGYRAAAAGMCADAVSQLWHGLQTMPRQRMGGPEEPALSVAVRDPAEALDWVPGMSKLGQRLARRCWPGPVVFVYNAVAGEGVASRLPESVRQQVCYDRLSLCMPGHDALLQALNMLSGPMLIAGIHDAAGRIATTAEQAMQALGQVVGRSGNHGTTLVIDDGPSEHNVEATMVRVNGRRWEIVRQGALPGAVLEQMSPCRIVFVCTGNTCRSPLAEALCKILLAERLGCAPEELPARGFIVQSAGLAAMIGAEAAPEAVQVARELGADLSNHRSQPLTADLLVQADYLIAMTRSHIWTLSAHVAGLGPEPRLLSCNGEDVADPIGCDRPVYWECSQEILRHLTRLVPEFQAV